MCDSNSHWHHNGTEWIELYKDRGNYYYVDARKYGRGVCHSANHANIFENPHQPVFVPVYGKVEKIGVKSKKSVVITYENEKERSSFQDIYFDRDDWENIQYGGEKTKIVVQETVTEVYGWDNSHVCRYCEGYSVSVEHEDELHSIACECGKVGDFITLEQWMKDRMLSEKPVIGVTETSTCNGR